MKTVLALSSLGLLFSSGVFAQNMSNEEIQSILTGAVSYDERCFVDLSNLETEMIPSGCNQYVFINSSAVDIEQRKEKTAHLIGVGFEHPYLLIKNPYSQLNSVISLLNEIKPDALITEVDQPVNSYNEEAVKSPTRHKRSTSFSSGSTQQNLVTTKYVREEIPFSKTERYDGSQKAVFEYKLDFFSRYPFFHQFGLVSPDNKKFVRVSLVKSPGINFHATGKSPRGWTQDGYAPHQSRYYSYPDYLDQVSINTSLNESDVELYDFEPKNTDKNLSKFSKTSTVDINIGISVPKVPIKSIGVKSSETVTYENGDFMGFDVTNDTKSFKITYRNKRYGSHITDHKGYCNLLKNTENWCWNYASSSYDDPMDLYKLKGTPYSNGFVPVFSSTYASPYYKTGLSTLNINAEVTGMNVLGYSYWAAGRLYYHGSQAGYNPYDKQFILHQYRKSTQFTIDWSSSIFSGAQPVTLSSLKGSDQQSQCMTVGKDDSISLSNCVAGDIRQLFYYTPNNKKYVYANDLNKCLSTQQEQLAVADCSRTVNNNNLVWQWHDEARNFSLLYTQTIDGLKVLQPSDSGDRIDVLKVQSADMASNDNLFDSRLGDFKVGG
ncbi:hypothetical protein A3K86_15140 [Photobacterium jeanii]|uniref:Uncharacterized protein n=1 Tax=Photobacterium jeanii TaxID=858640 RepID=A0A178K8L5_9GAMM|nr:hypothetical protein [Photobacterium jeanii]OAN13003.1 hypothetical protein A3K86_15140 [Photobacterium jeanii]PST89151.1 hypothetical protein C9I91_13585 [Photobacterium jeanii]